jgi:hypothetical protein
MHPSAIVNETPSISVNALILGALRISHCLIELLPQGAALRLGFGQGHLLGALIDGKFPDMPSRIPEMRSIPLPIHFFNYLI